MLFVGIQCLNRVLGLFIIVVESIKFFVVLLELAQPGRFHQISFLLFLFLALSLDHQLRAVELPLLLFNMIKDLEIIVEVHIDFVYVGLNSIEIMIRASLNHPSCLGGLN